MRIGCVIALLIATPAGADVFQTAETLPHGQWMLRGVGSLYVLPAVTGHGFAVLQRGVSSRTQLEARLGFGLLSPYVGAFAKWRAWEWKGLLASVWGGVHSQDFFHVSVGPVLSFVAGELWSVPVRVVVAGIGRRSFNLVGDYRFASMLGVETDHAFVEWQRGWVSDVDTLSAGLKWKLN